MGMTPLVITGVIDCTGDACVTVYEERRFLGGYLVFCKYCSPQSRPPTANEIDIADGTLRIEKSPEDALHLVQYRDDFDVSAEEVDGGCQVLRYRHQFRAHNPGMHSEHEAVIHIVLPQHFLPDLASIDPLPQYGWRFRDRFIVGWLSGFMQLDSVAPQPIIGWHSFTCTPVVPEQFNRQAHTLATELRALAATRQLPFGTLVVDSTANLLSAESCRQVHAALIDAYDSGSLAHMLRAQLGVRLDVVATIGDNFSDIVDDLIRWAEREGRMADLIRGASMDNETSARIQALRRAYEAQPHAFGV